MLVLLRIASLRAASPLSTAGLTISTCRRGLASSAAAAIADQSQDVESLARTMPPGFTASCRHLQTIALPEDTVTGSAADIELGRHLIRSWRSDGILQVQMDAKSRSVAANAFAASHQYFRLPHRVKAACVDDQSFSGYIASGEEITAGIADYSEIFTVTKDLPVDDARVKAKWPCHGPVPWPETVAANHPAVQSKVLMKPAISQYMDQLAVAGHKLLQLTALGLGLSKDALTAYTCGYRPDGSDADDGWHHLRVLRFPSRDRTNGKGKAGRGIGSHTDYGLLVIAAQDAVGGLFVRPPNLNEHYANWTESSAGRHEDEDGWLYVAPTEGVFTVFPGDMMQYITSSYLPSTPHKVGLNTSERFAFAYFHEPNFSAVMRPLPGFEPKTATAESESGIHYGTHFTNMFMRNYPDRITAERVRKEDRMAKLSSPELRQELNSRKGVC